MWLIATAVALLALGAVSTNAYILTIAINIGIWYLIVAGLNLLMGHAGQFSLCQAALFGTGAYTAAIVGVKLGLNPIVGLPAAVVAGALLAFAVGVPFTRLRGHYLAMATLAFQVIFSEVVTQWDDLTGGANGLIGQQPLSIAGLTITGVSLLLLIVLTDIAVFLGLRNLLSRRIGRALAAVKADELMAESFGIDAGRYRILAFVIAGAISGLAGFWFFQYLLFVDPSPFDLGASILYVAALVIGGQGTAPGPLFGVVIYYALRSVLAGAPTLEALLVGASLIGVITLAPFGAWGVLVRVGQLLRKGKEDQRTALVAPMPEHFPAALLRPDPSSEGAPLAVANVWKRFGGLEVLRDVSLAISAPGKVVSLIGPNGAGKTTLLNLITANESIDGGRIEVFSHEISNMRSRLIAAYGVARTFQVPRLSASQTVLENVLIGMHLHLRETMLSESLSTTRAQRVEREAKTLAQELLAYVGLAQAAHRPVRTLPHGPRRIVEIARALASRPRLLLLDEPAAGLTEVEIEWLATILRGLAANQGLSILLVDHRMDLVMNLSDEVVVLDSGQVICRGTPDVVRNDEAVMDAYLGRLVSA